MERQARRSAIGIIGAACQDFRAGKLPPRPEWTKSYLVPGVNKEAKSYGHPGDKR